MKGHKMKTIISLSILLLSLTVKAHDYHSKNFCSETTTDMCAHIGFDKPHAAGEEFDFVVDFINKQKVQDVTEVEAYVISQPTEEGDYYFLPTVVTQLDAQHWNADSEEVFPFAIDGILVVYKYQGNEEQIFIDLE